jgi:1A family penicillin-binding protein
MAIAKSDRQSKRPRLLKWLSRIALAGASLAVILVILLISYVTFWPFEVVPQRLTTNVLADDGELLTSIYVENRRPVTLDEISPHFLQAVIAVEDARFYRHHGIDFIRLGRVALNFLQTGSRAQGASTLTQQLARLLYLSLDKSFVRKAQEAVIALQLEQHLSKDEILEMYVNQNYMGHGLYGIQNISQFYFGKDAKDLSLPQAAMLAGVIQNPEGYSLIRNFSAARNRQRIVLNRMVAVGAITQEQAEAAYADEAAVTPIRQQGSQVSAGYVKEAIVRHLNNNYLNGTQYAYRGGLTVQTTINRKLQAAAEKAVKDGFAYLDSAGILRKDQDGNLLANVALVAIDPRSGEIKAMVGGKSYSESTYNRVYAERPPGSAFKPLIYAEALRLGKTTLATPVLSAPTTFEIPGQEPWQPSNFGGKFADEELSVREAIVRSDNVIAAKVMEELGPIHVVELAQALGIDLKPSDAVLSLSLGTKDVSPLELAVAFAAFANGGMKVEPVMIQQVNGPRGEAWETAKVSSPTRVLDERIAWLITDTLRDVLTDGTGQPVLQWYSDSRAAAKTGTTDANGRVNSAWIAGYTPDLVAVVYIGADDYNQPIAANNRVGGGSIAGPVWGKFMAEAAKILPKSPLLEQPEGIVQAEVCASSGQKATFLCPREERYEEYFLTEYAPTGGCPEHGGIPLPDDGLSWWQRLFPGLFGNP